MHTRSTIGTLMFGAIFWLAAIVAGAAQGTIGYDETKALFAGRTAISYDRAHGTQIEYISPIGKTYLFYPGNKAIVKGEWRLNRTDAPDVFNMCFRYPSNSYNPATGKAGGDWQCQIAGFYLGSLQEIVPGDPFGLSRRSEVPFILSPAKTSFMELIARMAR